MKVCVGPRGNELINRGWFNQGFQETLGVAGLAARLLRLDVEQTRMALGHAASAMAGMMKNRGTDTKGFTAGAAAMHGVMAGELASSGSRRTPTSSTESSAWPGSSGSSRATRSAGARRAGSLGSRHPRVDDPAARLLWCRALEHGRHAAHRAGPTG